MEDVKMVNLSNHTSAYPLLDDLGELKEEIQCPCFETLELSNSTTINMCSKIDLHPESEQLDWKSLLPDYTIETRELSNAQTIQFDAMDSNNIIGDKNIISNGSHLFIFEDSRIHVYKDKSFSSSSSPKFVEVVRKEFSFWEYFVRARINGEHMFVLTSKNEITILKHASLEVLKTVKLMEEVCHYWNDNNNEPTDFVIKDSTLFLYDDSSVLYIFNFVIEETISFTFLGETQLEKDIWIHSSTFFVDEKSHYLYGGDNFRLVDVSDHSEPVLLPQVSDSSFSKLDNFLKGFVVISSSSGTTRIMFGYTLQGLRIYKYSTENVLPMEYPVLEQEYSFETIGNPKDIVLLEDEQIIYMVTEGYFGSKLLKIDISDPLQPSLLDVMKITSDSKYNVVESLNVFFLDDPDEQEEEKKQKIKKTKRSKKKRKKKRKKNEEEEVRRKKKKKVGVITSCSGIIDFVYL